MLTPVMKLNSSPATCCDEPTAAGGEVDFARIGFGVGDEFGNGLGRERRIHLHDQRQQVDAGDRRDVADEIVIELRVERGVDFVGRGRPQQRVAVGRCSARPSRSRWSCRRPAGSRSQTAGRAVPTRNWPIRRATMSAGPPGAKPMTSLDRPRRIIERAGKAPAAPRGKSGCGRQGAATMFGGKRSSSAPLATATTLRERPGDLTTAASLRSCGDRPPAREAFRLDIGEFDDLGPFLGFGGDDFAEIGWRADNLRAAEVGEPRLDLGVGQGGVDRLVERGNDFGRRVLWAR